MEAEICLQRPRITGIREPSRIVMFAVVDKSVL